MDENTLKPCPFCGSNKLKIETKSGRIHYYEKDGMKSWQNVVFSVRCNSCHARGGTVGADLPVSWYLGDLENKRKEATDKAIKKWNNRKIDMNNILSSKYFVEEFNENKVSDDFLDSCDKAGKLFGRK